MPVIIPDEVLQETGLSQRELLIELACRLFDIGKLHLWPAAKLAGLSRSEMEEQLMLRKIPVYRPTLEDFTEDLATLEHLRSEACPPSSWPTCV